ncbi:MAG TPA: ABC transporter permease [Thermoanaerobaculia bacterium]|jgi:predicted permease|nr:ABC transporter permease [Thermoanaerobaculia bacterium]
MSLLKKASRRLQTLSDRDRFERDLDDELKFHLEMETAKNVERGMSPAEARALARRELGPVDLFKDEVRDARGVTWLDDVRRDVRFGLRSLRRSPAFTLVAVLCLALGIGANAALFSVINSVLLRPLPYPEPERLVRVYETMADSGPGGGAAVPNYRDWAAQSTAFEALTAWVRGSRNLQLSGEAQRIRTTEATPNLFRMLHARALRGRVFVPGQDEPGRSPVVVISEALWRQRFGGDPSLVGQAIRLDGAPYTVIGIMPASFAFPPLSREATDAWLLYEPQPMLAESRSAHFLDVAGRLKPGSSLEQASAQLKQIAARIEKAFPREQEGRSVLLQPLRESIVGRTRPALMILFSAVFLVLLIACANVANLLLARAAVRQREVAVRLALGAGRSRLVRQFLVESLVLALAGALLGLLLAYWGLAALAPLVEMALPLSGGMPLDGRVFLFLLAVAAFSGIAFGLVPALQASRGDVRESLAESAGRTTADGGQRRFRSALVVVEIALSLLLLIVAGLLLRGFLNVSKVNPGLVSQGVLTAHMALPGAGSQNVPRFYRPMLERVRALPGVRSAAVISMLPVQSSGTSGSYAVEGRPPVPTPQMPMAEIRLASPGFFRSLGIPLRGRDFDERDGEPEPRKIIVNDVLARREFPGQNPIGRRILYDGFSLEIIGVVGDVHQAGLDQAPLAEIYKPYTDPQYADLLSDMALVVKTSGDPSALAGDVQRAVREVDPGVPLYAVSAMDQVISDSLASRRLMLGLLGLFAGIALILSAAGLYGVISYLVAQRTREIGMRMALGAQARDVLRLVMGQGAGLTAAGIALGLLGALAATRVLENLLYGVSARDPLTFAGIAVLLALVALAATWLPARRAARVDPMVAIRNE